MIKRFIVKAIIGSALILALLGAGAANASEVVAHAAPLHHLLACSAAPLPPCN